MRDRHDDPSARDPLPGLSGVGRASPATVDSVGPVGSASELAAASATAAAHAGAPVEAVAATASDPVAAIGDALAARAIDAETAQSRLIDAVVASQMPPGADPAVWREVRREVEALLAGDPTLAALLRR